MFAILLTHLRNITLYLALLVPFAMYYGWANVYLLWDWSWYTVTALMLIRPIADLLPIRQLRQMVPWRRELGIFSAMVVVTAGIMKYTSMSAPFLATYFSIEYWSFEKYKFYAHMGELTGLILLLTSNTWSMRFFKRNWKRIQRLSYIYFFTGGIYIYSIGKEMALWSMIAVATVTILAFIKNYSKRR